MANNLELQADFEAIESPNLSGITRIQDPSQLNDSCKSRIWPERRFILICIKIYTTWKGSMASRPATPISLAFFGPVLRHHFLGVANYLLSQQLNVHLNIDTTCDFMNLLSFGRVSSCSMFFFAFLKTSASTACHGAISAVKRVARQYIGRCRNTLVVIKMS